MFFAIAGNTPLTQLLRSIKLGAGNSWQETQYRWANALPVTAPADAEVFLLLLQLYNNIIIKKLIAKVASKNRLLTDPL